MMKKDKKPAIVQCNLGDMGLASSKRMRKPHELTHIELRFSDAIATDPKSNLTLDIGTADLLTLRGTLDRISERYQIAALIPPFGYSLQTLEIGRLISILAAEYNLLEFGLSALAVTTNRFLTRCHWQRQGLPTLPFSLIQFPSALPVAMASTGYPSRLTPLHHALPHLVAHIHRVHDIPKAYHLTSRVMQRHVLSQDCPTYSDGVDPRTGHHIRFSLATDLLLSATPLAIPWTMTAKIQEGQVEILTGMPSTRHPIKTKPLKKSELRKMTELAMQACGTLGIRNGFATCMIHHSEEGDFLDGILPHFVDHRIIPAIEEKCGMTWYDIILETYLSPSPSRGVSPSRPADRYTPTPYR